MKLKELFRPANSKYSARQIMRWLWQAWRGNRLQAVLNASLGLLGVAVSLSQVWAVKHAIDVASHVVEGSIYWAVGLMAALILADFGISISSIWVRNILGIKAQNRMQQRMLDRILRSEWHGRERLHSGDVLNRLEIDVNNVVNFLTETIPGTLSTLALFLGAFFYLFSMDYRLALVIIIIVPLFVFVSRIYIGQMRRLTRQVRDSDSKVQSVLQETIQNRMLIKTLESDGIMVDRLRCDLGIDRLGNVQFALSMCARLRVGRPLRYAEGCARRHHSFKSVSGAGRLPAWHRLVRFRRPSERRGPTMAWRAGGARQPCGMGAWRSPQLVRRGAVRRGGGRRRAA